MNKKVLIGLVIGSVLGLGGWYVFVYRPSQKSDVNSKRDSIDIAMDALEPIARSFPSFNSIGTLNDNRGKKYIEISVSNQHDLARVEGYVKKYLAKTNQTNIPVKVVVSETAKAL